VPEGVKLLHELPVIYTTIKPEAKTLTKSSVLHNGLGNRGALVNDRGIPR
jgi:hypothetical protein